MQTLLNTRYIRIGIDTFIIHLIFDAILLVTYSELDYYLTVFSISHIVVTDNKFTRL